MKIEKWKNKLKNDKNGNWKNGKVEKNRKMENRMVPYGT